MLQSPFVLSRHNIDIFQVVPFGWLTREYSLSFLTYLQTVAVIYFKHELNIILKLCLVQWLLLTLAIFQLHPCYKVRPFI